MTEAELLGRARSHAYNCAHFAADVWERETGRDIRPILSGFLAPRALRKATPLPSHDFTRIPSPVSPCVVLFARVKAQPHVGVFVRGRVVHLTKNGGIRQLLDVAALGYTSVRFYAPR